MRRPLALTLVLAFLLALVAPVRSSWACPDGTPCVHDEAQAYVCAARPCAAQASCCEVRTTRCKHGELPESAAAPAVGPDNGDTSGGALGSADHCRYSLTARTPLVARTEPAAQLLAVGPVVLPALFRFELAQSMAPPVWRAVDTLGYRPPPLLRTGPSRAPPAW